MGDEKPAPVAAPRRRLGRYALGVAVLLTGAGAVAALGLRMKVESAREALKERVAELEEARKRAAVESTNLEDRKKALEEKEAEVSKVGMELGPLISFVGSQANLLPETGGETSGPPAKRDEPIDLNVEEVGLAECMATISSQVGCTIVVAPDVHEKVTVALRHIPWEDAVQVIAKMTKCDVSPIGSDTLLLSQCPKVTIQFTQADVRTVLQLLAAYCGKNIIVAPSVHGDMVTLDLHEVDWLAALRGIVATNNLHAVPMGDAIVILPGPGPDPFAATPRGAEREIPVLDAEPGERNVDVTVEDADLREVCDELGRRVGRNVIVEPDVHEKVTVDLRRIAFSEALRVLGWLTKCRVERRGSIYVLSQPPKVTLQASGTPAHKWFQLLAAYAGENIVVAPEVTGAVTMDLHEVDWMDAIKATALAYGFEVVERDGHLLTVRKKNIDQRPGGVK
jgi:type II secretory pathway component HofQ